MLPYLSSGSWNMSKVTLEGVIHSHNGPWNSRVSAHLTDEFSAIMNYMKTTGKNGKCSFKQILVHDDEKMDESKAIYICDAVTPFKAACPMLLQCCSTCRFHRGRVRLCI